MRWVILALAVAGVLMPGQRLFAAARYLGVTPQGNPAAAAGMVHQTCRTCHGEHGVSLASTIPDLAGQKYGYLVKQLEDFRSGSRKASTMSMMVKTVPVAKHDQNIKNLASYFAEQKTQYKAQANASVPPPVLLKGAEIYEGGLRVERVPACAACHGTSGLGIAPMAVPALAGQHAPYVLAELKRFADGKRHNSPHHVMALIARRLTPAQMEAVADYVASLDPTLMLGTGPKTYHAYMQTRRKLAIPGVPDGAHKMATAAR